MSTPCLKRQPKVLLSKCQKGYNEMVEITLSWNLPFYYVHSLVPVLPSAALFSNSEVPEASEAEHMGIHSQRQRILAGWSITTFILDSYLVKAGFSPGTLKPWLEVPAPWGEAPACQLTFPTSFYCPEKQCNVMFKTQNLGTRLPESGSWLCHLLAM